MVEYKVDPFKEIVRELDRRVFMKGGNSLFGRPYPRADGAFSDEGTPGTNNKFRLGPSNRIDREAPLPPERVKELSARRHGEKPARFNSPKPGRIRANSTISGYYDSRDDT